MDPSDPIIPSDSARTDVPIPMDDSRLPDTARYDSPPIPLPSDSGRKPTHRSPQADSHAIPADAETFGRYRLVEEVGRGGMGVVWKAWDPQLERFVALKRMKPDSESDADLVERFLREARLAAKLRHPGIVAVHEVGTCDGRHYFTADFIEGSSLHEATRRDSAGATPRPIEDVLRWIGNAAEALHHAHTQGVLHRDVKPANILIDRAGRALLTDFGLGKGVEPARDASGAVAPLTLSGQLLGTPEYMSPEQAGGRVETLGPAGDQFSLGVTLYESLTGRRPFARRHLREVLDAVCTFDPPSLRRYRVDVPRDVETVCLKALEKDPARRYRDCAEFAADLARAARGEPILARRAPAVERALRGLRRHRTLALACALLALPGLALAFHFHRTADDRETALALAEARLRKGERAQAVLARWTTLAPVIRKLEESRFDATKSAETRRATGDSLWPEVDEFVRATPTDPSSQSTMKALAGWARRLAGHEEEGMAWMTEARALDPDLPYGALMQAQVLFAQTLLRAPLPLIEDGSLGLVLGPVPEETPELREARTGLRSLLEAAGAAKVWGEGMANDIAGAVHAMQAMQAGAYAEAETGLTAALGSGALQPLATDLRLARGKVRYLLQNFPAAEADLEAVVAARPGQTEARRFLGEVRFGAAMQTFTCGDDARPSFARAIEDFTAAMLGAADAPTARHDRGLAHLRLGAAASERGEDPRAEYAAALADLQAVEQNESEATTVHLNLALLHLERAVDAVSRGEDSAPLFDLAIAEITDALRRRPAWTLALESRATIFCRRAEAEAEQGKDPLPALERAAADLDVALQRTPGDARLHHALGIVLLRRADAEEARGVDALPTRRRSLQAFDRLVAAYPNLAIGWCNRAVVHLDLARTLQEKGEDPRAEFAAAFADLEASLRLDPHNAEALSGRGSADRARGDYEKDQGADPADWYERAIADFGRALESRPQSADLLTNRGLARVHLAFARAKDGGDLDPGFDAAIADFTAALRVNPRDALARHGLGRAHLGKGDCARSHAADPRPEYEQAVAAFQESVRGNPSDLETWINLSLTHLQIGRWRIEHNLAGKESWQAALEAADEAIRIRPDHWKGYVFRAEAIGHFGRFAEEVADYETAVRLGGDREPAIRENLARAREDQAKAERWMALGPAVRSASVAMEAHDFVHAKAGFEAAIASVGPEGETVEPLKPFLLHAHYNLACVYAWLSLGKSAPEAAPIAITPAEAAAHRDCAFGHLEKALALGLDEPSLLDSDTDLTPLRGDPRWKEIRGRQR